VAEEGPTKVARLAVERGLITATQLRLALEEQERRAGAGVEVDIGDLLVERGLLTRGQLDELAEATGGGRRRLGGYELLSTLGRGGMGSVLLARQVSMDRLVALKVLRPMLAADRDFVTRFLREARLAGKLDHPNLVRAIDVGEAGGRYYMAMEYVEGRTVQEMMDEAGSLPERQALEIALQMARALDCAHRHGIIHRDIKPANILIDKRGVAKLADLGLAKQVGGETRLTQTGVTMGSPDYISPEQAGAGGDVDIRGDIYSLGVSLFHMVTGRPPFDGPSAIAIMTKHVTDRVPWPQDVRPEVSEGCARLIARMTAREPEDRYQTPAELISDVQLVLAGELPGAAPRAVTDPTMVLGPGAPGTPPVAAAAPAAAGGSRLKRWTVNCLAILGGIFLLLILVGTCSGGGGDDPGPESGSVTSPGPGPEPEEPPAEDLAEAAPAESLLFVTFAGRERLGKHLAESSLGELWDEPKVREFLEPLVDAFRRRLEAPGREIEKETGGVLRLEDLKRLTENEAALALLPPPPPEGRAAPDPDAESIPLLIARLREGPEGYERLRRRIGERVKELHARGAVSSAEAEEVVHCGVEVSVVRTEGLEIACAFVRGVLVVSADPAAVCRAVECLRGDAPALAGRPGLGRADDRLLAVSIDLAALRAIEDAGGKGSDEDWKAMRALGFDCVRRISYRLSPAPPHFRESLTFETGEPEGVFALAATGRPLEGNAAEGVPGDALGFAATKARAGDALKVFKTVVAALDGVAGSGFAADFAGFEARCRRGGLELDALAGAITGEVTFFAAPPERLLAPPQFGVIAGVRDRGPVKDLLTAMGRGHCRVMVEAQIRRKIVRRPLESPEKFEMRVRMGMRLRADEVRNWQLPRPIRLPHGELYLFPTPPGKRPQAAVLFSDRVVIASTDLAAKKAAATLSVKPAGRLAARRVYSRLAGELSPEPFLLAYLDSPKFYSLLHLLWGPLARSSPELRLDPAKVPPAEDVARRLRPEVLGFYSQPRGQMRVEAVTNVPLGALVMAKIVWEEVPAEPSSEDDN
jgi:serine/threonine-protein kinase